MATKKKSPTQSDELNIDLLEKTFAMLAPKGQQLVARFYEVMFANHPEVKPMFAKTNPKEQQKKLLNSLVLVVENLRKPEKLLPALRAMGARHQSYGVIEAHYEVVVETLLVVMHEFAGDAWTDEIETAWRNALNKVSSIMLDSYSDLSMLASKNKSEKKSTSQKTIGAQTMSVTKTPTLNNTEKNKYLKRIKELEVEAQEAARLKSALEGSATANMQIDRDFIITYANPATVEMVKANLDVFKTAFKGFDLDSLIGTCIDIFHKNPAHQRKLLKDPNNLPYKTDIHIGHMTFRLNVSTMRDNKGEYIGNNLEWQDATNLRAQELAAARLQSTVDGSATASMQVDRDLVITYANPATVNMVKANIEVFKKTFRGFDLDNLIGTCIDIFHKNPDHQRKLLGDPNNLPYQADIQIGHMTFRMNVSAMRNVKGDYIGNNLEWHDVTNLRVQELEAARLRSAIEGSATAMMMIDRDFNITYANPATVTMVQKNLEMFRNSFPGFDFNKLIGANIDAFHKKPEHQRKLLADPKNLPYSTKIKVGDLSFQLSVSAMLNAKGNYIGNTLEWANITNSLAVQNSTEDAANRLNSSANELVATANQMAGNAEETSAQSNNVSSASEEVSRNIGSVATAIEEMNTTIKEVSDRAAEAAKVADEAVEVAGDANKIISQLGASSQEISKVIKVITSIAEQTNLLALNATIEAARAGEAGKGFAVVANEVKELAKETAKATEDITQKIEQIQSDSSSSVDSIQSVGDIINKINEIANTIASAVEEQAATANEISRNVVDAATGADSIVENIEQVSRAASNTAEGAKASKDRAEGLTDLANELQELVKQLN